jgi:integrase
MATNFDLCNKENQDIIMEWINENAASYHIEDKTYMIYIERMARYALFCEANHCKTLYDTTVELVRKYKDTLMPPAYSLNTIHSYLGTVKKFLRWCVVSNRMADLEYARFRIPQPSNLPNYIPTAQEIFRIRSFSGHTIMGRCMVATAIEMMLSSGMRVGELTQVKPYHINWQPAMYDQECDRLSPYVGASIDLSPQFGFKIKFRHRRVVYISKLAAKLLKKYMQMAGITDSMPIRLFPVERQGIGNRILEIADEMQLINSFGLKKDEGGNVVRITNSVEELTVQEIERLDIAPKFKKQLLAFKANREAKKRAVEYKGKKLMVGVQEKPRIGKLSPHAFRHFFGVMMYYRAWTGARRDIDTVQKLMGHSNRMQTEMYIAGDLQRIRNDNEWYRIVFGNGFEYMGINRL